MHAIDTEKYEVLPIYLTKRGVLGGAEFLCFKNLSKKEI